ncbi:proteasome inhibitor PI31 subunit [Eucyclogobius newberryi]|uniref:proteasome inhibitor PI31 subunit n=1 Tax=Eucyclogobius newberryi TaxID=166745 RepID=UPI003B5CA576
MAGLEVLYACFGDGITCANDAVVCFVHWELIRGGYRCIGSGDEARSSDKKSELLPSDWSSNKELYTLRYKPTGADTLYMLKGIPIDSALLFNFMNTSNQKVFDLVLNTSDYVNADQLRTYNSVYKDVEMFSQKIKNQLLPPPERASTRDQDRGRSTDAQQQQQQPDRDPRRVPHRHPVGAQPDWPGPLAPPFGVGGADLDPFGSRGGGGMILDPLRSGYPRSGFDPSSGIPDILPPGAVPPGARFDPFGPIGRHRPRPDPDHMPPPGYDDMFM